MKKFTSRGLTISLGFYVLLHYITYLYPSEILLLIFSISGLMAILFTSINLKTKQLMLPLFLVAIAVILQIATDGFIINMLTEGIKQMRSLIALLLIVPIIGWVLREEPYIEEIMSFSHNFLNTSKRFYFGLMAINQTIAYFLLFGAIPMMYQLVNGFLGNKNDEAWENYKGTALLRSFALTTLWVISIPSFIFAVDHLGASLTWSVLQGFLISLCGIFLAVIFSFFQEKKYGVDISAGLEEEISKVVQNSSGTGKRNPKVFEFVILFISLFGTIFLLHMALGWELLIIIPIIIILWTIIYFLMKKKTFRLGEQSKSYVKTGLEKKSQQFSLLLSAGLLIYSINDSGLGGYIVDGIFFVSNSLPFLNFLIVLPFVVIALGFFGLGPLTVIVLVAGILENVSLPYPPELVVLAITSGSVISILLSPLILPVIVLSSSNGLSVIKNGIKFNLAYAIAFYIIVQIYLQLVSWLVN